jgi:UDPglucose 6-dehydrogenase
LLVGFASPLPAGTAFRMSFKKKDICVVGAGYVGLVTGACLSHLGHRVVVVDSDRAKIDLLRAKKIPIHEPGLDKLVRKSVREGRLFFAHSIPDAMKHQGHVAEVVFIAVGTPPRADGSADLSSIESVAEAVARNLMAHTLIVEKSTVPVETGEWILKTVQRFNRRGVAVDVASNPEFLREGSAIQDFLKPDRIVFGVASKWAETVLREVYGSIDAPMVVTDLKSAEMIKHASNSFLATKISFINAVSSVCEKVGADIEEVARGMGLDRRIGPSFLKAGLGYGGFCLPKDLEAFHWISRRHGYDFELLKCVRDINEAQKDWVLRQVEAELWNLEGKLVGVWGLAFKPDTDDMRFAPSIDIIERLQARGVRIQAFDPVAAAKAKPLLKGVRFAKDAYDCAANADCLLLVTEWDEFKNADLKKVRRLLRHPILIDGRNVFEPSELAALGFSYRSVGRAPRTAAARPVPA